MSTGAFFLADRATKLPPLPSSATLARNMDPDEHARAFYFNGRHVGYFESAELPSKPGHYRYMPFRSVGHYQFIRALGSGNPQRCHFVVGGTKRHFLVLRLVEYGVLEIAAVEAPEYP